MRSRPARAALLSLVLTLAGPLAGAAVEAPPAPAPPPAGVTAVPETPAVLPVEDAVARTLASPRYQFCFDSHYPLVPAEAEWCEHLPRSPDARATRCPGFVTSCRMGASANTVKPRELPQWRLPDFGGLGRLLMWTLAICAVGSLLYVIVRGSLRLPAHLRRSSRDDADAGPAAPDGAHPALQEEIERDVERLLARARAAAAAGDFAAAVVDLHAALFRRLEGDGHVRIHSSATNGDYVRELRTRAPHLAATVADAVRDVERAEFAVAGATQALYVDLLGRITPIVRGGAPRAGASATALLLLAATALAGLVSACGGSLRSDWPASPSGTAAVLQVLTATGIEARERFAPLSTLNDTKDKKHPPPGQIILLSGAELKDADWEVLRVWLGAEGRTLVLATGARKLPVWLDHLEIVADGATGAIEPVWSASDVQADEADRFAGPALRGWVPGGAWVRSDIDKTNVLMKRGARAYATVVPTEAGRVFALADGALFTNAALVPADNAQLLVALLLYAHQGSASGVLEVVGEDTGLVAHTPLASVSRGRLAPFMIQLGACLVLFLLMQGRAFGRLIDPEVTRRRVFGEHVRALGTQYARAHASGHVLAMYATWAVERLRERIRLPGDRSVSNLAEAVASRAERPLGEVARILFAAPQNPDVPGAAAAAAARSGSAVAESEDRSRATVRENLAAMRELGQLVADVSGAAPGRARVTSSHGREPARTPARGVPRTTGQIAAAFTPTMTGNDRPKERKPS